MKQMVYLVSENAYDLGSALEDAIAGQHLFLSKNAALDCADELVEWNSDNQVIVITLQVEAMDVCTVRTADVSTEEDDCQILMNNYEWREAKAVF